MLDEASGLLHFPYTIERGVRFPDEPIELIGYRKHVMDTREPLMIAVSTPELAERYGNPFVLSGEPVKSALFVPLVVGGRATGVVSLQNLDRDHAFTESDQQLLETLAASLSVALENARLVHETRQRNTELALINSVQAAIAGELDPQAIYDHVGDKVQAVFDAQVVSISVHDEATGLLTFPYVIERGERLEQHPIELIGFRRHVMETREPLMIAEVTPEVAERYGNPLVLTGAPIKSALFVPLIGGGRVTGVVSLQNVDRTDAFSEDDQRLLTTLAGSLSVALDNARLLDESRQRVAELATVNSVGQALSSQLDLDALIDLVGEKVRETFEADIAYVALHDRQSGRIDFPYYYERGAAPRRGVDCLRRGADVPDPRVACSRCCSTDRRSSRSTRRCWWAPPVRSFLGVPIVVRDAAIGVISVQSIEEEGRFAETDSRLLATIAANVGVAIQNARLFSEVERQRQYLESLVVHQPRGGGRHGRRRAGDRLEPGRGRALRLLGRRGTRPADRRPRLRRDGQRRGTRDHPGGHDRRPRAPDHPAPAQGRDTGRRRADARPAHGGRLPRRLPGHLPRRHRAPARATGGRGGDAGQERVPRHDEPRDPDADERRDRHDRSPARHRADRRAAGVRRGRAERAETRCCT